MKHSGGPNRRTKNYPVWLPRFRRYASPAGVVLLAILWDHPADIDPSGVPNSTSSLSASGINAA